MMQSQPLSTLMRSESALLERRLHALAADSLVSIEAAGLGAIEHAAPVSMRLQMAGTGQMEGDARAACDAWPFPDEGVDVVVLRHALEFCSCPRLLLGEALRVVARGGHVLIAGVHPCSLWHACNLRRIRGVDPGYRTRLPWQLEAWMRSSGMRVEPRTRYGGLLPDRTPDAGGGVLAACYLLHARKAAGSVTPLKLAPRRPTPVAINASLAGAAQRQQAR